MTYLPQTYTSVNAVNAVEIPLTKAAKNLMWLSNGQ